MLKRLAILTLPLIILTGCPGDEEPAAKTKTTQAEKAAAAAESIQFTENAEIENIKRRVTLTSQPGLQGFVALVNKLGNIVMYTPVKGKITSGGKRLTPTFKKIRCDKGEWTGDCFVDAPSDEGTHGRSNPYIYFWTPGDQYIQTDMSYVYSDKPFRLKNKPLIMIGQQSDKK